MNYTWRMIISQHSYEPMAFWSLADQDSVYEAGRATIRLDERGIFHVEVRWDGGEAATLEEAKAIAERILQQNEKARQKENPEISHI